MGMDILTIVLAFVSIWVLSLIVFAIKLISFMLKEDEDNQ